MLSDKLWVYKTSHTFKKYYLTFFEKIKVRHRDIDEMLYEWNGNEELVLKI